MSHFEFLLLHYHVHSILEHIACFIWEQAGLARSAAGKEEDMFKVFPISVNIAQFTDGTYFGTL